MRILLLSAYDADSHRYWHDGLTRTLTRFDWTRLCLPPRYFSWRIRGNPLSWIFEQQHTLSHSYDLLVATSMVDVATLKGLVPSLAHTPTLVYFHENQFAYPPSPEQFKTIEAQMVTLYSALAADLILFNSLYNRDSFLIGVDKLLAKMPDHCPRSLGKQLKQKSEILCVPLEDSLFESAPVRQSSETLTLVWNHRWEYDKAPERLYKALCLFKNTGIPFKLHILGKRFRKCPSVFEQIQNEFCQHIGHFGMIESRSAYLETLRSSHIVISTALHEFQGLSILEAVACGCIPVVPDRLSYAEFIPGEFLYPSWIEDEDKEAEALASQLIQPAADHAQNALPLAPCIDEFSWKRLAHRYETILENIRCECTADPNKPES